MCGIPTENQFHFQFVTSFKLLSQSPAKGVVLEGGEAGVETGGAGIAHDVLFRLAGGLREVRERWGQEGEVRVH